MINHHHDDCVDDDDDEFYDEICISEYLVIVIIIVLMMMTMKMMQIFMKADNDYNLIMLLISRDDIACCIQGSNQPGFDVYKTTSPYWRGIVFMIMDIMMIITNYEDDDDEEDNENDGDEDNDNK